MAQKLYTEEQVRHAYNEGWWNGFNEVKDKEDYTISSLTPIELPSDEEIYWNDKNPNYIDSYIVHRGAEGVSLGYWNGEEWIQMWGDKKLNVYGWIKIPNIPIKWMKEQILNK